MIVDGIVRSEPLVVYADTRANIEAAFAVAGMHAYATDTGRIGWYDAVYAVWRWGVVNLNDLADVNAPYPNDGDFLTYDATTSQWIASTAGPGGVSYFISLLDTPSTYHGRAGYGLVVDGLESGLVFIDFDTRYFRESEYIVISSGVPDAGLPVILDGTGRLDISLIPGAAITTVLNDLLDVNAYPQQTGDVLTWDATTSQWVASTGFGDDFVLRDEWLQNGFVDRTEVSMSWNDGTRTLTISPSVTSFSYHYEGVLYTETNSLAATITDTEGLWLFYIGSGGASVLSTIHNPSDAQVENVILNECVVAYVYWDATNNDGRLLDERHGSRMSPETHHYLHETRGSVYLGGLTPGDITTDQDGSADSHAQFSITAGKFYDEDLPHDTLARAVGDTWECYYVNGAGDVRWVNCEATFPVYAIGGVIAYNNAGVLTAVTSNRYICYHVFATNIHTDADGDYYPVVVPGTAQYITKAAAQDAALSEIQSIDWGDWPTEELIPIATIIYHHGAAMTNGVEAAIQSTEGGGDFVDWRRSIVMGSSVSVNDHGALSGLADDDHAQYLLVAGTRAMTGNLDMDSHEIQNVSVITIANTGLRLLDTGGDNYLTIKLNEDVAANRTLNIVVGAGDRTLTLSGNLTVESASLVNQDLTTDANVNFAQVTLPDSGKLILGTGGDGEIYSSSDDLYIVNVTQDKDIRFQVNDGGVTTDVLVLYGSEGNVGIKNTAPTVTLHMEEDGDFCGIYMDSYGVNNQVIGRQSLGSKASPSATNSGNILVSFSGRGHTGSAFTATRGLFGIVAEENFTAANQGTYMRFDTTAPGTTSRTEKLRITGAGNFGFNTTTQFGNGVGVLGIANAGTNPSANPTGGGVLYSTGGAGTWRGSGGTITTFGPAEPHCQKCGRDFVLEWKNEKYGHLIVCMWCLTHPDGDGNPRHGVVTRTREWREH